MWCETQGIVVSNYSFGAESVIMLSRLIQDLCYGMMVSSRAWRLPRQTQLPQERNSAEYHEGKFRLGSLATKVKTTWCRVQQESLIKKVLNRLRIRLQCVSPRLSRDTWSAWLLGRRQRLGTVVNSAGDACHWIEWIEQSCSRQIFQAQAMATQLRHYVYHGWYEGRDLSQPEVVPKLLSSAIQPG